MPTLSISFDHAQRRRQFDRLSVFMTATELDSELYSNTWIDPLTKTLMLRPAQLYAAWWTTHTGLYAKLTGGSLEFLTSGNWSAVDVLNSGQANYYLTSTGAEWMRTSAALAKNRPVFVSYHNYAAGDEFTAIQFGWGSSASTSTGVAISITSTGAISVYKSGAAVASGRIGIAANKLNSLLLIPCRRRELLIVNIDTNDGFRVVFADIAEDASNPTITPAEKFWALSPTGSATIQICPVNFETSGYATSQQTSFADAPVVTDVLEDFDNEAWAGGTDAWRIWGDQSYQGTTGASATLRATGGGAWTPDGTTQVCRIRATLTGDGSYTPFVEAVEIAYAPVFEDTDASEQVDDAESFMNEISLSVPEGPEGAQWNFTIFDPENRGVDRLTGMSNRPVLIKLGAVELTDGLGEPGLRNIEVNAGGTSMSYTVRDFTAAFETFTFPVRKSLRGYTLDEALTFCLSQIVDPAILDIEASTLVLGDASPASTEDQSPIIEEGDSLRDWVERLHEMADREYGFVPTLTGIEWISKKVSTLGTTPFLKLYQSIADAIADGVASDVAPYRCYGDVTDDNAPPVANEVRVTGFDPRGKRPLHAFKLNTPARDVTTAPSLRPDDWVGEGRRAGVMDPELVTQSEVSTTTEDIYDRVTAFNPPWEISADFPVDDDGVPLWKTHRVELDGYGIFAVLGLSGTFILENETTDGVARDFSYLLKYLGPAA
jgi:hypothetical protein